MTSPHSKPESENAAATDVVGTWHFDNGIRVLDVRNGGLGIDVGGLVIVKPPAEWHRLASAQQAQPPEIIKTLNAKLKEALDEIERLRASPQQEPAAWIRKWPVGDRDVRLGNEKPEEIEGTTLTPLYAFPQQGEEK